MFYYLTFDIALSQINLQRGETLGTRLIKYHAHAIVQHQKKNVYTFPFFFFFEVHDTIPYNKHLCLLPNCSLSYITASIGVMRFRYMYIKAALTRSSSGPDFSAFLSELISCWCRTIMTPRSLSLSTAAALNFSISVTEYTTRHYGCLLLRSTAIASWFRARRICRTIMTPRSLSLSTAAAPNFSISVTEYTTRHYGCLLLRSTAIASWFRARRICFGMSGSNLVR